MIRKKKRVKKIFVRTVPQLIGGFMATIKEVAAKAGVSKSTISRYILQKGYVSD